jgi:hypothetical protein
MLIQVLALRRHVRRQFEGLEMDVGADLAVDAPQCLLEAVQADRTPGAGNVRDEIDLQVLRHVGFSSSPIVAEIDGCPPA